MCLPIIKLLLASSRTNVNAVSQTYGAALHIACADLGSCIVVDELLRHPEIEVDAWHSGLSTPLHAACRCSDANNVNALLAAGADPSRKLKGRAPVQTVAQGQHEDKAKVMRLLLDAAMSRMNAQPVSHGPSTGDAAASDGCRDKFQAGCTVSSSSVATAAADNDLPAATGMTAASVVAAQPALHAAGAVFLAGAAAAETAHAHAGGTSCAMCGIVRGGDAGNSSAAAAAAAAPATVCPSPRHKRVKLRLCLGCDSVRNCSEECQQAAWLAGHKEECNASREAAQAGAAAG